MSSASEASREIDPDKLHAFMGKVVTLVTTSNPATLWTEQFRRNWEARFEALDSLLDEMKSEEQTRSRRR